MTVCQMQQDILRLKKELGVGIYAHSYQSHDILEIADHTGDSFQLSLQAAKAEEDCILLCGVRFMAETAKLLCPQKRVVLAAPQAGCPMAEQVSPDRVLAWRADHPDGLAVCYINTTAALKAVCDVAVTSSSAEKIVGSLPDDRELLFVPDPNLGGWLAARFPQKRITLMEGGCPYHSAVTAEEVREARRQHPAAKLLIHPECTPDVSAAADFVGSTAAIMSYALHSDADEFIIGTENSIVEHLSYACPDKRFYPLSAKLICADMKLTTLPDVRAALLGRGGEDILLPGELAVSARRCIDEMIRLG